MGAFKKKKEGISMGNKLFLALIILCIAPAAFAVEMNYSNTNIESQHADIYVSILKYEPFPVAPGEYFNLWLKVENKGDLDAPDLTFTLEPQYPFFFDSSETAERNIGKLESHQSALINYKVRVDEKAVEGNAFLHYEYRTADNKKPVSNTLNVKIQTPDAILTVYSVKTEPSTIAPGEASNIQIDFKNPSDSFLRYISVALVLYSPMTTTPGTAYEELPFTPVGGGSEKTIYQIGPGQEKSLSFDIIANPDAESKPYKIPLEINYYDEIGKNYSRHEIVGVIVGSKPEVYTTIESEETYGKGMTSDLPIKFVNTGTSDVKFLNVKLLESEYYKIISTDQYYIGKIDSDDYDTATFKINLQKIKNGQV
ncbi:hypothetical protein KY308_04490, partial [Candidatus Woesearchaeota archaeon]|nr:hypothetical protein [Candidatus Woesearchaeota archaeon]